MARTSLTPKAVLGQKSNVYTANAADLTMTAADVANKNQATASGNDLILAHNTGAAPHTITITSIADVMGRTGDISAYSLGAGEYALFGPHKGDGWTQTDGKLYFEADHAEVKFAVVQL